MMNINQLSRIRKRHSIPKERAYRNKYRFMFDLYEDEVIQIRIEPKGMILNGLNLKVYNSKRIVEYSTYIKIQTERIMNNMASIIQLEADWSKLI